MLCYVMLCYVMLCYVMLSYVMMHVINIELLLKIYREKNVATKTPMSTRNPSTAHTQIRITSEKSTNNYIINPNWRIVFYVFVAFRLYTAITIFDKTYKYKFYIIGIQY